LIEAREWHTELSIDRTLRALSKNDFKAFYVPNKEEAVSRILELVPSNALVGLGGSVTLRELSIPEILKERDNRVADHWAAREREA